MVTGTKQPVSSWVARNMAYFAFPSVAGTGYNVTDLTLGVFPPHTNEACNASFITTRL